MVFFDHINILSLLFTKRQKTTEMAIEEIISETEMLRTKPVIEFTSHFGTNEKWHFISAKLITFHGIRNSFTLQFLMSH
jgi:hypothetical protein